MVEGLVFPHAGVNPVVVCLRGIGPQLDRKLRLHPQKITPFHGPVIGELIPLQQLINEPGAAIRIRRIQKCTCLLLGGWRADHAEIGAAQKDGVGAEIGRLKVQLLQPFKDQLIQAVAHRSIFT